jgi:predicted phosphodiesterase
MNENVANDAIKYYLEQKDYQSARAILDAIDPVINILEEDCIVLVIGDIHEPFAKKGYLEFCQEQYKKFNCDKVVFIGDIIDNCYSSFHNSDPDGYAAGEELDRAIDKIQLWYKAFPDAIVILGNHDRLAYRKAFAGGISKRWLRSYGDILNTPGWDYQESIKINGVLYIHGEAGTARTKAKDISGSVVQGHLHSQAYCEFINNNTFAVQVGCGIDDTLYAFNYGKAGKESVISCGIIIDGKQPLLLKF